MVTHSGGLLRQTTITNAPRPFAQPRVVHCPTAVPRPNGVGGLSYYSTPSKRAATFEMHPEPSMFVPFPSNIRFRSPQPPQLPLAPNGEANIMQLRHSLACFLHSLAVFVLFSRGGEQNTSVIWGYYKAVSHQFPEGNQARTHCHQKSMFLLECWFSFGFGLVFSWFG